jgi:hypothetical protein
MNEMNPCETSMDLWNAYANASPVSKADKFIKRRLAALRGAQTRRQRLADEANSVDALESDYRRRRRA